MTAKQIATKPKRPIVFFIQREYTGGAIPGRVAHPMVGEA
jgi:hypothetical protein